MGLLSYYKYLQYKLQVHILHSLQFIDFDSVLEMINLEVFNIGFGKITTHSCRAEPAPVD